MYCKMFVKVCNKVTLLNNCSFLGHHSCRQMLALSAEAYSHFLIIDEFEILAEILFAS